MREPTLREFVETKLVISGFAVDNAPDGKGILAWPRGMDSDVASFVIAEKEDGTFAIASGSGRFASKKMHKVMNIYIKQWYNEYKLGARK